MSKLKKFIARNLYPLAPYKPIQLTKPAKTIEISSAWKGLELIIEDILN